MLTRWRRWCRRRCRRGEVANLNVVEVDSIRTARNLSDFKSNSIGVVNRKRRGLKRRRTGGHSRPDLGPGAAAVGLGPDLRGAGTISAEHRVLNRDCACGGLVEIQVEQAGISHGG